MDKIDAEKDVVLNGVIAIHTIAKKLMADLNRLCHRCQQMEEGLRLLRVKTDEYFNGVNEKEGNPKLK